MQMRHFTVQDNRKAKKSRENKKIANLVST